MTVAAWVVAILVASVGMGVGACVETEDRVVVEITASGVNVAEELDTLELTVTASRTAAGDSLCVPYTVTYSLATADSSRIELPYSVEVVPGATFDKLVYVRVVGRHYGTVRYKSERMASLSGGDSRLHVVISADCLGVGTGYGQHCQGGLATESPYARIFDEDQYVVPGEKCRTD